MKTSMYFLSYPTELFLKWEMLQTKVVEKINAHFMFNYFFQKSFHLWDNVEKYCRAGQATVGNVVHPYCILDT